MFHQHRLQLLHTSCYTAFVTAAVAISASSAIATEVPSLEEIKDRLRQQRDKIRSLYVETTEEQSSPLSLEELRKLPGHERLIGFMTSKADYAFKGEKRYFRRKRTEIPMGLPPVQPLRPNATPMQKAMHKLWVEQERRYKQQQAAHPTPRVTPVSEDEMKGFNGRSLWTRRAADHKDPDGRIVKDPPIVNQWSLQRVSRIIYPPTYLKHIGLTVAGADLDGEPLQFQHQVRRNLLPDLLELGTYAVQDKIEEVEGAKCVVLRGTVEHSSTLGDVTERYTTLQKLWFDLDRGLALCQRERTKTPGTNVLYRVVNSEFEEVATGVWLPKQTESRVIAPADGEDYPEQYRGKQIYSNRARVTKLVINKVPDKVFEPYIQPGDRVHDSRDQVGP